jgi:hypothetical protein
VKGSVAALACLLFIACGDARPKPVAETPPAEATSTSEAPAPAVPTPAAGRKHQVREDCSSNAGGANFPGAFSDPNNLVVGPLVIIPGASVDREAARLLGGARYVVLVTAGHTVTVRLAPEARTLAGLAFGPLRHGRAKFREAYRSVTFVACGARESTSDVDGEDATLWLGYVLIRRPECIPLDVSIDGGAPQRVGLTLGARC